MVREHVPIYALFAQPLLLGFNLLRRPISSKVRLESQKRDTDIVFPDLTKIWQNLCFDERLAQSEIADVKRFYHYSPGSTVADNLFPSPVTRRTGNIRKYPKFPGRIETLRTACFRNCAWSPARKYDPAITL